MAGKLFARMDVGDLKKIKPDNDTYKFLIYAYLDSPSWEPWAKLAGAEYALSRAHSENLYPENQVLISLLDECKNDSNEGIAMKIMSYMPTSVLNSLLIEIKK